ncbi:MAG: hypothetical protein OEZ02_08720 [Anaerolineae bacterium]|nr:hypothetical protein [Anaerolineae bacterium]
MSALRITKLKDGEEIVFGPIRSTQTSALSVRASDEGEATHTSQRTVCVSNRRVIVESGDAVITLPNQDVKRVVIKQNTSKTDANTFNLLRVESKFGQKIKLEIPGIGLERQAELAAIFPYAAVGARRGLLGWLEDLLGD